MVSSIDISTRKVLGAEVLQETREGPFTAVSEKNLILVKPLHRGPRSAQIKVFFILAPTTPPPLTGKDGKTPRPDLITNTDSHRGTLQNQCSDQEKETIYKNLS